MKKGTHRWIIPILLASCLLIASCAGIRPFAGKDSGKSNAPGPRADSSHVYYGEPDAVSGQETAGKSAYPPDGEKKVQPEEPEDVTFLSEIGQPGGGEGACREVPIESNEKVDFFVRYFQGPKRDWMYRALQRSGRYRDQMREILHEEGLPEDLVYLALIESGYNPYAYSCSGAVGIWQFMAQTGKRYGLKIDWWVDERRDLDKATRAAARYLKDLYGQFGDWYLAAAAYNAGEGKLQRAILACDSTDFWHISTKNSLKTETKDYVPKFLAALMIAKDPERYGFGQIQYDPPLLYETVEVPEALDLNVLARACGQSVPLLRSLNPQLKRAYTAPRSEIRIPRGTAEQFKRYCANLDPAERVTFRRHVVRKGESLANISRRYGVPARTLVEMNELPKGRKIRSGTALMIPVACSPSGIQKESAVRSAKAPDGGSSITANPSTSGATEKTTYEVKRGDTLWKISNKNGVSLSSLCEWNHITPSSRIHPGQQILVRLEANRNAEGVQQQARAQTHDVQPPSRALQPVFHVVRAGDSLWRISRKYGVTLSELCRWNKLDLRQTLRPGATLRIFTDTPYYADSDALAPGTMQD